MTSPINVPADTGKLFQKALKAVYQKLGDVNDDFAERLTTSASDTVLSLEHFHTILTTDGTTGAGQAITLADGSHLGERKLITVVDVVDAGTDTVTMSANIADTSYTFAEDDDSLLLEFNGTVWAIVLNLNVVVA